MVQGQFVNILHVVHRNGVNTSAPNLVPGVWTATVQITSLPGNSGSCTVQVRVQSNLQIYYGFVTDIHNDFPAPEPIMATGYNNSMVAHVTNLPTLGTLEYMNLFTLTYNMMGSARFVPRLGCSYDWYSQPFQCSNGGFAVVVH